MSKERDDIPDNPVWPDEEIWLSHNICKLGEIFAARWWQQSRLIVGIISPAKSLFDAADPESTLASLVLIEPSNARRGLRYTSSRAEAFYVQDFVQCTPGLAPSTAVAIQ